MRHFNIVSEFRWKYNDDQDILWWQIDATDRQIDQLVYELYGLNEEEIRLIEETTDK